MALPLKRSRKFVFLCYLYGLKPVRHGGVYREIQQEIQPARGGLPAADRADGTARVPQGGVRRPSGRAEFRFLRREPRHLAGALSRRRRGCLGLVRRRGRGALFDVGLRGQRGFENLHRGDVRRRTLRHLQSRPGGLFRPIGRSGQFREEAFRGAVPGARKLDALGRRSAGRGALPDADGGKPRTAAIRAAEAHRLLPLDHAAVVEPHPGQTGEEKGSTITVNPFFRHPTAATRPRGPCTTPRARGARCAPPCSPRPVRRRTSAGRRARRCSGSRR